MILKIIGILIITESILLYLGCLVTALIETQCAIKNDVEVNVAIPTYKYTLFITFGYALMHINHLF